ncbi:serine acetyltransferase [Paratrimastix pyriformis]|uniref:serine O-acetyltransferase n=1 Tax=Paratrimastix pyriformis TaxID=342808 RepID=A0ABQ8UQC2_9EUKA|nr:serine acetyltransferase [Paratrimastix pyriformis]
MRKTLEILDGIGAKVLSHLIHMGVFRLFLLALLIMAFIYICTFIPSDVDAILKFDPATRNIVEALLCMPGLHAVWVHRIAHITYKLGIPLLPRMINYASRFMFAIDIHPGATLGKGVVIDHALGTVIGETAVVGDYCLIYQGVTLGGTGKATTFKRHPTVGSHCVIGCGAKVLGPITIGNHVRIGAGSVVLHDVPDSCTAVGVPARIVARSDQERSLDQDMLQHQNLPDVEAVALVDLHRQQQAVSTEFQRIISFLQTFANAQPSTASTSQQQRQLAEAEALAKSLAPDHSAVLRAEDGTTSPAKTCLFQPSPALPPPPEMRATPLPRGESPHTPFDSLALAATDSLASVAVPPSPMLRHRRRPVATESGSIDWVAMEDNLAAEGEQPPLRDSMDYAAL